MLIYAWSGMSLGALGKSLRQRDRVVVIILSFLIDSFSGSLKSKIGKLTEGWRIGRPGLAKVIIARLESMFVA